MSAARRWAAYSSVIVNRPVSEDGFEGLGEVEQAAWEAVDKAQEAQKVPAAPLVK